MRARVIAPDFQGIRESGCDMLAFKIADAVLLASFIAALVWIWRHQRRFRETLLQNDAMPREASRGLIYGFLIFLLVGAVVVSVYWLF